MVRRGGAPQAGVRPGPGGGGGGQGQPANTAGLRAEIERPGQVKSEVRNKIEESTTKGNQI